MTMIFLKAGTYTANHSKDSGMPKFAEYDGVRVGIFLDNDGFPSTIFLIIVSNHKELN